MHVDYCFQSGHGFYLYIFNGHIMINTLNNEHAYRNSHLLLDILEVGKGYFVISPTTYLLQNIS